MILPGAWSVPENNDPIIIASAPAANALARSPENFIPPSAIKVVLLLPIAFLAFNIALY